MTPIKTKWHIRWCGWPYTINSKPYYTFGPWLYWKWQFTNRFGVNEKGIRLFGIEICNWNDNWFLNEMKQLKEKMEQCDL